ncbi:hypothetical protein J5U22_02684 [Saccharolobus shibatae]|uniref:Uncharacterized protein n=1 Tax=Saccharolobus shibatae TaxID=2286 RepID=A0A8F5BWZ3_9CREN|nr:hypothetical protein J5U21_02670 [Saccharolobus shibatae]QXJ36125.1 hypothetical protein J5U22_02684 [Saccharolobus shibatae]
MPRNKKIKHKAKLGKDYQSRFTSFKSNWTLEEVKNHLLYVANYYFVYYGILMYKV